MFLKTNLHFHTSDDPVDRFIKYDFYEGIDRAASLGFEVIALTAHNKRVYSEEYEKYAAEKGILLIPAIEKDIEKRHVVILNADSETETINKFSDLKNYKKKRPDIFVIAPHPYFFSSYSLNGKLKANIELFDAVECSWFYSKNVNLNLEARKTAEKHELPFIATSDTHLIEFLDTSYAIVETAEKNSDAVLAALRNRQFQNITSPRKLWQEMIFGAALKMPIKL